MQQSVRTQEVQNPITFENEEDLALPALARITDYTLTRDQGGEFSVADYFQLGGRIVHLTERAKIASGGDRVITTAVTFPGDTRGVAYLLEGCDLPEEPDSNNAFQIIVQREGSELEKTIVVIPEPCESSSHEIVKIIQDEALRYLNRGGRKSSLLDELEGLGFCPLNME